MSTVRSAFAVILTLATLGGCAPADDQGVASDQPAATATPDAAVAPAPPTQTPPAPTVAAGAQAPAATVAAEGPLYLDVRTPAEYQAGHVPGAILIPHDQMAQRWQELEAFRDRELVVYCRSGRRSGLAIDVLKAQGFTKLENGGGLDALSAARGLPIVTD